MPHAATLADLEPKAPGWHAVQLTSAPHETSASSSTLQERKSQASPKRATASGKPVPQFRSASVRPGSAKQVIAPTVQGALRNSCWTGHGQLKALWQELCLIIRMQTIEGFRQDPLSKSQSELW